MIVRWGLDQLPGLLEELGIDRPFLVAGPRWEALEIPAAARWTELPSDRITVPEGVDGIVAVGGGSHDRHRESCLCGVLARAGLRSDDVFRRGMDAVLRDPQPRPPAGGGQLESADCRDRLRAGADTRAAAGRVGRHRAERTCALRRGALSGRADVARRGAAGIDRWLPAVLEDGRDLEARTHLLEAASDAGDALATTACTSGTRWRRRPGAASASARSDERNLPPAGDALQRDGRAAGDDGRSGRARRGASAARRLSPAPQTPASPRTSSTSSARRRQQGRGEGESEAGERLRSDRVVPLGPGSPPAKVLSRSDLAGSQTTALDSDAKPDAPSPNVSACLRRGRGDLCDRGRPRRPARRRGRVGSPTGRRSSRHRPGRPPSSCRSPRRAT